jgi:peptidoglycan/xylan/chitin deacetylase (PgdA/CDA1 family)
MTTRLAKLAISALVGMGDTLRTGFAALAGHPPASRAVVLYYHAVNADERAQFARQMDQLKRWATPVSAGAEAELRPGVRYAAVTFDDGFVSVIENALPELEARRIPMTFFVPTGCFGQRPSWVKNPQARSYQQTVLTPEQLRRVSRNPWVVIGAHSITHPNFLTLDEVQARAELAQSKAELERVVGREVSLFSFPHGRCNARLIEWARDAGYRRVFTISPDWAYQAPGEYVTGRVAVEPSDWSVEFRLKLKGAFRWQAVVGGRRP